MNTWALRLPASLIAIATVCLVSACSEVCWSDDEARAAAIRYLRKQSSLADDRLFYVVVDGAAPSPRFMNCVPTDSSLIAASSTTHDFPANKLRSGADAHVTLWAADFDQTGEHHGSIRAGYYGLDGAGESVVLSLRRSGGRWAVVGRR